jgi:hypothetical protein
MLENTLAERTNGLGATLFAMGSEIGIGIGIVHCSCPYAGYLFLSQKAAKFGCQRHHGGRVCSLILGQILVKSEDLMSQTHPYRVKAAGAQPVRRFRLIQSLRALWPVS